MTQPQSVNACADAEGTREHTNLAILRATDKEAPSILAIKLPADCHGDGRDEVVDVSSIAPPAHTSRRNLLMNTIVSVASLASASAMASPALSQEVPSTTAIDDRQRVVGRAEQMVALLRDRFVCAGWHERFDEQRAAKFLDAIRREDWSADNDPASPIVRAWVRDHGQSFDWLYTGDLVSLICGAARRSPIAAAIPTGTDPIFAAIE